MSVRMRKNETVSEYIERKVKSYAKVSDGKSLVAMKRQAIEHFNAMSPEERLTYAEFNCEYERTTDKIGNLYYGQVRIWIDRQGNIYANRPKGKEFRYK